jgi:hypothetical protein
MSAAIIVHHLHDGVGHRVGGDHMAGQHLGQLILVLRLQKGIDRAVRQRGKGCVGRREHGKRTFARQRFNEAAALTAATSVV